MRKNPFSLKGKVILITGASSGIGRQCAIRCSEMGAVLILVGRREGKLKETIGLISSVKSLFYSFDVTNYPNIEQIITDSVSRTGPINGFIHSAGVELTLPLAVTRPSHYQKMFETNVFAGFEFAKILSKRKFMDHAGSSFVFISSVMGIQGSPSLVGYSATKGALIAGVKSMALELAPQKIRVNTISPGHLTDTEMSANMFESLDDNSIRVLKSQYVLGFGTTNDVAHACVFLLSDASKWVTGTNLIVDGGYSAK